MKSTRHDEKKFTSDILLKTNRKRGLRLVKS